MAKIKIDTKEYDILLLDVMLQCCGNDEGNLIDNKCISVYEDACDHLTNKGYLITTNGRMYKLTKKAIKAFNS